MILVRVNENEYYNHSLYSKALPAPLPLFFFLTVVHVRILTEGINESSLDTHYRISIINIFKMNSSLPTFRSVWILRNLCSCPLLRPGKQYLLTGKMTRLAGYTKIIAEVSRESYVEEWTRSMLTRMEEIKSKRCSLIRTTWMTTSMGTKPESTSGITLDFPNASSFT